MSVNDAQLYTGVDGEPEGMFGNETKDEVTKEQIREQDRLIKELTPKLQDIVAMIDREIEIVNSIDHYGDATSHPEVDIRAELRAAFLYKKYLGQLKTNFALALGELKKGE